jgi:uncharacterized protein
MDTPFEILARSQYVLLTTFRRDGTAVPTPVWVVDIAGELVVWTNPAAGKVKRIRRNPQVQIAPCTRVGTPLGRQIAATARVLQADELSGVMPALVRKYGLTAKMTSIPTLLNKVLGRPPHPVGGLAVTVADDRAGADEGSVDGTE